MKSIEPTRAAAPPGFALVATLTLMVLLSILALCMVSLSAVSLRNAGSTSARSTACSNARMALMLAISELQKNAGPDQRVTARADILDKDSPNPAWTGAWRTDKNDPTYDKSPAWLVSGANSVPSNASLADNNSVVLSKPLASSVGKKELRAPLVRVSGSALDGSYAWWVGDEGVKARVDIKAPSAVTVEKERRGRSRSPQTPSLVNLGGKFTEAALGDAADKSRLATVETVGLAAKSPELPKRYFDDITAGGFGIPANVRDGGMKSDLSLVFDRSQQGQPFVAKTLGATPSLTSWGESSVYDFNVTDMNRHFLSKSLVSNVATGVGPNWGNLFHYARLWEIMVGTGPTFRHVGPYPLMETKLRDQNWPPYKNNGNEANNRDRQHVNSSVSPVLSMVQIGMFLGAEESGAPELATRQTPPPATKYYKAQLHIKPVIAMWNPYNVPIKAEK